jgi:hypothetical protein
MKRKFVKVMFFGALALSTVTYVGCKDYDDDIKNVQEQIDAINKKGADVTTEAIPTIPPHRRSQSQRIGTVCTGRNDSANYK